MPKLGAGWRPTGGDFCESKAQAPCLLGSIAYGKPAPLGDSVHRYTVPYNPCSRPVVRSCRLAAFASVPGQGEAGVWHNRHWPRCCTHERVINHFLGAPLLRENKRECLGLAVPLSSRPEEGDGRAACQRTYPCYEGRHDPSAGGPEERLRK